MPLSPTLRSRLGDVPPLDHEGDPPELIGWDKPSFGDLSYSEFIFDQETDQVDQGGNAVVYCAALNDQLVALKRPFPNRTVDDDLITEILNEADKWARVDDHPYIATVHGWGFDSVPWIAIEYCDGGTLSERMSEFGFRQRCWTAYAIIDAAAFACGRHGVSHHDLNPENILFRKTSNSSWDVPTIVDWGLSRELIQHTGTISQATPEYAAPEQFDALRPNIPVGVHTDVYQLGVLCYELLTGKQPSHLSGDVPPASEVAKEVPQAFDNVLSQAVAHDYSDRFEHPLLFREAFTDALWEGVIDCERGPETVDADESADKGENGESLSLQRGSISSTSAEVSTETSEETTNKTDRTRNNNHVGIIKDMYDSGRGRIATSLADDGYFALSELDSDLSEGDVVTLRYKGTNPSATDITSVRLADDHTKPDYGLGIIKSISNNRRATVATNLASGGSFAINNISPNLSEGDPVVFDYQGANPTPADIESLQPMFDEEEPRAITDLIKSIFK